MKPSWEQNEHKSYHLRNISAKHLGLDGEAWLVHAWGNQYYCMVKGTWGNGNAAEGCYCRATPEEIDRYLLPTMHKEDK